MGASASLRCHHEIGSRSVATPFQILDESSLYYVDKWNLFDSILSSFFRLFCPSPDLFHNLSVPSSSVFFHSHTHTHTHTRTYTPEQHFNTSTMSQVNFLFEYPSVGRDVVSQSAPGVNGPTYGPDPEVHPYEDDSGSDSEDYESEADDEEEEEKPEEPELDWHPNAINFLAQIPPDDAAWSSYLPRNGAVNSLCHRLRIPFLFPGIRGNMDWERFFAECKWHLARACNNPPLASLFTLVFIAACHIAAADGLPRAICLNGMRECVRQCGIWEYELTDPMIDRLREGAVKGIWILNEYTRAVGVRAHEIPLFSRFPLHPDL